MRPAIVLAGIVAALGAIPTALAQLAPPARQGQPQGPQQGQPQNPPAPTLPPTLRQAPPTIVGPANQMRDVNMLGEPDVAFWNPQDYAVQGEQMTILLNGTLAASAISSLRVRAGQPSIDLPIIASSFQAGGASYPPRTTIRLRVPPTAVSGPSPLTVQYGSNGPVRTLSLTFKLLKKARVASFRVIGAPTIHLRDNDPSTTLEVELADFDAFADLRNRPVLFSPCIPDVGFNIPQEFGNAPNRFVYRVNFRGIEMSGKRCALEIRPYGSFGDVHPGVPVGAVQLPSLSRYTISNTWELQNYTTSSGKRWMATASKGHLPCQLGSVGTAGNFPTGVVNDGGDLSFQVRNGLLEETCEFKTSMALEVKDGWAVEGVDWGFTRDQFCSSIDPYGAPVFREFAIQMPSGSRVNSGFSTQDMMYAVLFQATCKPDGNDAANNRHLYKARLENVRLIGPAGQRWQDAFK